MKAIALISGGKDSCHNAYLCQKYGHEIIALGNLLPERSDVDELDSYMFQTVGHQLVEAYAQCTGLPLFRKRILGSSQQQGLCYSKSQGDEVEDLYQLLAFAKQQMPEIQAVASGAIASDYQRLRVENVCSRLGLMSLAYLWHQPQDQLLQSMIDSQLHAVLVKVAALGLDPHRHLGRSLAQLQPHLRRIAAQFGGNICGEGGEYESLTLDCPLFSKGRLVLDNWEVLLHSPDAVAPVGILHPTAFHVEAKCEAGQVQEAVVIHVPDEVVQQEEVGAAASSSGEGGEQFLCDVRCWEGERCVHLCCSPSCAGSGAAAPEATAAAVAAALRAIEAQLQQRGLTWACSTFVHLYLSDMAHFGAANAAYCSVLPQHSPPSRACVQLPLPPGCPAMVDVLLAKPAAGAAVPAGRRVLHVQSMSSWAPSCIGPYSQASACRGLLHMAGQIPLEPGTMALVPGGLEAQAQRALQSCEAVAIAQRSSAQRASLAMTVYVAAPVEQQQLQQLQEQVAAFLAATSSSEQPAAAASSSDDEGDELYGGLTAGGASAWGSSAADVPLDSYLEAPDVVQRLRPAVLYVTVPALPRGCLLEVQPLCVDVTLPELQPCSSSDNGSEGGEGGESAAVGEPRRCVAVPAGCAAEPAGVLSYATQYGGKLLHVLCLAERSSSSEVLGQVCMQQLQVHGMSTRDVVSSRVYHRVQEGSSGGQQGAVLAAGLQQLGLVAQAVPVCGIACGSAVGQSFCAALEVTASMV